MNIEEIRSRADVSEGVKEEFIRCVTLVPAWTIIGHQYLWVIENGKTLLKQIKPGKIHGMDIEILEGLVAGDQIIVNPESIAVPKYQIL